MADEAADETDARRAEYEALERCLGKLPEKQRSLVTLAYSGGASTKEMAEEAGVRPGAFYMRLNRIRGALMECIEMTIKQQGLA